VGTVLLEARDLSKSFGGATALRGVSLEVQSGEFHAILGENGAGKSTLVKIIAGIHPPSHGQILWRGQELGPASAGHLSSLGIGTVHQDSSILPELTVLENFALGHEAVAGPDWMDWAAVRSSLEERAAQLGVGLDPSAPARTLSVGDRKLVELLRVIHEGQQLLVLDEPTASFTPEETLNLMRILEEIKRTGCAILFITHRLHEIEGIVDRVTVLKDGEKAGTLSRSEATHSSIIALMLGRDIGEIYPPAPSAPPGDALLSVVNLERRGAFRGVNLTVHAGEIVSLVGLAGHGSFEAARAVYGVPSADSGDMVIGGRRLRIDGPIAALRAGVGFLSEDRGVNVLRQLSVRDNLGLASLSHWSRLGWVDGRHEDAEVRRLIGSLSVRCRSARDPMDSLSGGNQQKVALGRWLAADTRLLVLLDPTAGVDVGARADIYGLLRAFADSGRGVLIASSDLGEALGLSDTVYAFYRGQQTGAFPRAGRREADVLAAMTGQAIGSVVH